MPKKSSKEDNEITTPLTSDDDMQEITFKDVMKPNQEKIVKNAITTLENVVKSINPFRNAVEKANELGALEKANSSLVRAANFFKKKFKSNEIKSIETNTTNLQTEVKTLFEQLKTLESNVDNAEKIFPNLNKIENSIRTFTGSSSDPSGNYGEIEKFIKNIEGSTKKVNDALKLTTKIYNKFNITANAIEEIAKEKLNLKEIK